MVRFGAFELDLETGQLLRNRRAIRLKPQPFKLLHLLASRPGDVVTREEIRTLLWGADTYVDFEQGVNTAIKQIRDALNEDADHPLYVETVPKRGYRFIAPVEGAGPKTGRSIFTLPRTDLNLHKALWLNIAEMRLAEVRRRALRRRLVVALALVVGAAVLAVAAMLLF
jgi:DNA-binding winged helix-turn-helix (wHTH) protein